MIKRRGVNPRAKALIAVLGANALLLLGCAELDKLMKGPNANKPVAQTSATPTPAPTPTATPVPTTVAKGATATASTAATKLKPANLFSEVRAVKTNFVKDVEKSLENITPKDERALGQATSFHIISKNGGILTDQRLMTYVNEVGNLVAQHGERWTPPSTGRKRTEARRFFFGVVASDEVNAYAAPGGYIFVTRGLLEGLTSEADLAWVLGHEITHVDHEDGLTGLKAQAVVQGSGFFGKPVEGASSLTNQDFFSSMVGKLVDFVGSGRFGAGDESRADQIGLQSAIKAGYDPRGAQRAINSLASKSRRGFGAHESPDTRLGRLSEIIEKAKPGKVGAERFDEECIQRIEASLVALAPVAPAELEATPTPAEVPPTAEPTTEAAPQ